MVQARSQAGIDPPDGVLAVISQWLNAHGVSTRTLTDPSDNAVGVWVRIDGLATGPTLCLDACVDTAPVGDLDAWNSPPFEGVLRAGELWGRGSADSKTGAAMLAHLAAAYTHRPPRRGSLHFLFDADEHTGSFGGVKAYLEACGSSPPEAMILAYPGHDTLVTGARGFLRCEVKMGGVSAHSGSASGRGVNAISRIARFVARLEDCVLPQASGAFPLGPKVTVTQIYGGGGFSQVPDTAVAALDIRLTPTFDRKAAVAWLGDLLAGDGSDGRLAPPTVRIVEHWPAYSVPDDHVLVRSFQGAGERIIGRTIPTEVCGPSNIGNLLSTHGVTTICGLGVGYRNLHAADECANLSDLPRITSAWTAAIDTYLADA